MASSTAGISIPKIISCSFVTAIAALGTIVLTYVPTFSAAGLEWPFVLLTALGGLFLVTAGLYTLYTLTWQDVRNQRIAARYPDQPWMLNPQWAAGRLVDRPLGRIIVLIVFVIGWVGGISIILTHNWPKVVHALQHQWHSWLLLAFFALLTVTVFNLLFQSVRQGWTIGSAMLTLGTIPGRLGGAFEAQLNCRLPQDVPKKLTATLTCYRWAARDPTILRPVDKNRMLWWKEIEVPARRAKGRLLTDVHFDVPDDLPESGTQPNLDDIVWMLRIDTGSRTKEPLNFQWEVPIFATDRAAYASRVPRQPPGIDLG